VACVIGNSHRPQSPRMRQFLVAPHRTSVLLTDLFF
jgi:hypothetical protein